MNSNTVLVAIVTLVIGLAAGFMIANKVNRSELGAVRTVTDTTQSNSNVGSELDLTDNEIDAKLSEADASSNDIQFQKRLGISLYRYGTMKRDASIIEKALVPLGRANTIAPDDKEIISTLGNAYFDIGYFKKENGPLVKSRDYYEILLKARPDDIETRTDLGLTYFLVEPPDFEKAAIEFQRSLEKDPKHEKTLQFYVQTLVKLNRTKEANDALAKLRAANPKNPALSELTNFVNGQTVQ
jgi:tetratricopeptide (TPR) repeat protein